MPCHIWLILQVAFHYMYLCKKFHQKLVLFSQWHDCTPSSVICRKIHRFNIIKNHQLTVMHFYDLLCNYTMYISYIQQSSLQEIKGMDHLFNSWLLYNAIYNISDVLSSGYKVIKLEFDLHAQDSNKIQFLSFKEQQMPWWNKWLYRTIMSESFQSSH